MYQFKGYKIKSSLLKNFIKSSCALVIYSGLFLYSEATHALTLIQAYQMAIQGDPTLQAQAAQYRQDLQLIPQARSQLLPNAGVNTTDTSNRLVSRQTIVGVFDYGYQDYMLDVTEPIFDYAAWANLAEAKAQVKQARATFDADVQSLIANTVSAYLGVLQAKDNLEYSQEEEQTFKKELSTMEQTYKVKLGTITDVYNAKAQYDQSITSVIFFQNQIQQRAETLSQIIGVFTSDLSPFETNIPLIQPNPANINDWVNIALQQNFSLAAARYNMQANLDNISVQRAGHLPVLDATGNYQRIIQGNNGYGDLNQDQFTGGIEITFPVYQGGLIVANTRAAEAQYQQAEANMQVIYRKTVSNTRQNYKNIISGIQQLKADKQAIASAYSSMKSNETAFTVGERTIIDVLNSQVTYIDNKRIYSEALYTYLNSIIALKQAAGTLGIGDVLQLNNWLQQQPFTTINQNKKP